MSAHMKKHHTKQRRNLVRMRHEGQIYQFPRKVAEKYCITDAPVTAEDVFSGINKAYTRPGALLKGIRARENLTQVEIAEMIDVTQSDISQMENGTRSIGRNIAKRIEKLFCVDYRSFLE